MSKELKSFLITLGIFACAAAAIAIVCLLPQPVFESLITIYMYVLMAVFFLTCFFAIWLCIYADM